MQVRTVREPGERGTQRLVDQYGERLVCVRYRYDPQKPKRYETVELIIAEESSIPAPAARVDDAPSAVKHRYTPRVPVRIRYHEKELCSVRSKRSVARGSRQRNSGTHRKSTCERSDSISGSFAERSHENWY